MYMKLTNNFGIPHAFEAFEELNAYSKGDSDISVTTLIDAPQIRLLRDAYEDQITEDVSDRIMSILGTAIHNVLQAGARDVDIAEHRLYCEIGGLKISGAIDLFEYMYTDEDNKPHYKLNDYKSLSGNGIVYNPDGKVEWVRQLNCYNWLAWKNDIIVDELEVIAVIRDWSHSGVRRNSKFPKKPVQRMPIEMWPMAEVEAYMEQRVELHQRSVMPQCTSVERWSNGTEFAVHKHKRGGGLAERAARVLKSSVDAQAYILEKGINADVVKREPVSTRCVGNYCQVSQYCEQYEKEKVI
jgi:hypothetical protein